MEIETIKELIKAFSEAELTKLSLKCEDFELKLGKEQTIYQTVMTETAPLAPSVQSPAYNKDVVMSEPKMTPAAEVPAKAITSPMVGTFYAASSPKAKPFVEVGSKVKKGDVESVIEAMKLMNEVEAEIEGEVVEILAANESMVEFGQPLFILK